MRAFEFQATAHQHLLRLPDTIPDGVPLRVLLLLDEDILTANQQVRRKPSPKLAGTVTMQDDLIAPAIDNRIRKDSFYNHKILVDDNNRYRGLL